MTPERANTANRWIPARRGRVGFPLVGLLAAVSSTAAPGPASRADLAEAGNWPTWRGDPQRSGRAAASPDLPAGGEPSWVYRPRRRPDPAWPETAPSDHWRRRTTPETPKVTFDWVSDVVVAGGGVYFGSSADDAVRCLDAASGEEVWRFFAGGPVRLAPSLSGDRLLFGCDDGFVYCLDAGDGRLMWRARPPSSRDRRLPGNGRMMSVWPVRTGVLVDGDTGYFGAGLFPEEGAWYCTVDLRDGRVIDERPVDFSPQGYIFERGGRLFTQAGRAKSDGALGALAGGAKPGSGTGAAPPRSRISKAARGRFPHGELETPDLVFVGGERSVAAFEPAGAEPVWEAAVDAPARGLAAAGGRLFVSTTSGSVYAFGPGGAPPDDRPAAVTGVRDPSTKKVDRMIAQLPRGRGYALVVGVGDGSTLRALAGRMRLHVVGVDTDGRRLSRLRAELADLGIYGAVEDGAGRGSVALQEVESLRALPFVEGIFNLVTTGRRGVDLPRGEARRLVRPWDGVAFLPDGETFRGEVPEAGGSWTHAYADVGNTASSGDRAGGGDLRLHWFGRPGPERIVDRHLRAPPPLAAGGYLLVPGRNYLFGLDAHNGTVLWEREIPDFMRASMLRDCGNLVLDPGAKRVFAASGPTCLVIDVDTGATRREIPVGVGGGSGAEEWGYLASAGGLLVGSAVDRGAIRRELSYAAIWEGGYGDGKRVVCSRRLFAVDPATVTAPGSDRPRWIYRPRGAIPNPSICIEGGRVYFLESRNRSTLAAPGPGGGGRGGRPRPPGRWSYAELVEAEGADLVALDLDDGAELWRRPFDHPGSGLQTFYLSVSGGHLVAVDSRNARTDDGKPRAQPTLHYDVQVMAGADGSPAWKFTFDTGRSPNLSHGEQDLHPVIAGGRLVVEPHVFDLASGEALFTFRRQGGAGCGTISASSSKLYYRASHPAEFDLEQRRQQWVSRVTRPGCWINMIPADGLLLVPEGSSGCICSFPVQASMAYRAGTGDSNTP